MRELKFRAKIAEGLANAGQWIYWGISGSDMLDAIDPGTVGQYTGIIDTTGNEIYEGDIISLPFSHRHFEIRFWGGQWVHQERYGGCFYGVSGALYPHVLPGGDHPIANVTVVGNIHDTPELLHQTNFAAIAIAISNV